MTFRDNNKGLRKKRQNIQIIKQLIDSTHSILKQNQTQLEVKFKLKAFLSDVQIIISDTFVELRAQYISIHSIVKLCVRKIKVKSKSLIKLTLIRKILRQISSSLWSETIPWAEPTIWCNYITLSFQF